MDEITKIAYNCRKATLLIEKKQLDGLSLREKLELKIHLAGCIVCRVFERQSILINRMVHDLLYSPKVTGLKLDEKYKKQLQERIEKEMNKH
jgi:hypothetical protein